MTDDERKEIQKSLQRVVCASIQLEDGTLLLGARHWDHHMLNQAERIGYTGIGLVQGFIDQFGNFLDRRQAWKVAQRQKQLIRKTGCEDFDSEEGYLFSENLY